MIKVHIWLPKADMFGHASMHCRDTYISWWPSGPEGRVPSTPQFVRNKVPKTANIYAASPIRNRTFIDDIVAEERHPQTINLDGLNEREVLSWWASFGLVLNGQQLAGPLLPWETTSQNCSSVVATGLAKGGGDKFASMYSSWSLIWRPQTVKDYAESILAGLNRQKAKR